MSIWDSYPSTYRAAEVGIIVKAVRAGDCASVIGLSGAGKSNLMGFLAHRVQGGPCFAAVDCNELPTADFPALAGAIRAALGETAPGPADMHRLGDLVKTRLDTHPEGLCLLLDRFDLFLADPVTAGNLRALRDKFKYALTYVTASRAPLDTASELAELFYAHTVWLGALSRDDAFWSIRQYCGRNQLDWGEDVFEQIFQLSGGYPSMLRAVCEAVASGVPLELTALRASAAVTRRVEEFWRESPSEKHLRQSRLINSALLMTKGLPGELTAAEQRLLGYFSLHVGAVCGKEELIAAVWPEEKLNAGLRDDSLTQLVHRLREKIGGDGREHIQTVTGRGYRYRE